MLWMACNKMHRLRLLVLYRTQTQRFMSDQPILLRQGQVGTVVELLGNGEAFEVEFADREGQAYAMLAIVPEKLMVLQYEPLECLVLG